MSEQRAVQSNSPHFTQTSENGRTFLELQYCLTALVDLETLPWSRSRNAKTRLESRAPARGRALKYRDFIQIQIQRAADFQEDWISS